MSDPRPAGGNADPFSLGAGPGRPAPAPVAVDIGIVAALSLEVGFLVDRLSKVRKYSGPKHTIVEGEVGGKLVALIVSGMGREAARTGTRLLLDGHRPRWLVSAGFAGALAPGLSRNAVVMANEVIDLDGHRYAIDVAVPPSSEVSEKGPQV